MIKLLKTLVVLALMTAASTAVSFGYLYGYEDELDDYIEYVMDA